MSKLIWTLFDYNSHIWYVGPLIESAVGQENSRLHFHTKQIEHGMTQSEMRSFSLLVVISKL